MLSIAADSLLPPTNPADDQQRQKRIHTKVRTGCTTCKARRIKCDEVRPVCSRCRLGNRKCVYAVLRAWIFEPRKEIPVLTKVPPPITLGDHDERRAFDFFKQATVSQFAGHHDLQLRFWGDFIPQTATSDSLVFKLAVAMGSQHEAVAYGKSKSSVLAKRSHDAVVATLARHLTTLTVDISLLCCVMLMGYANLCEDVPATAAVHFSLGLRLLREETLSGTSSLTDSIDAFIEPMFGELELATALFGRPPKEIEIICPHTPTRPILPAIFNDLYEAKQNLCGILRWLLWLTVLHRTASEKLTAVSADVDVLLTQWRQTVVKYSLTIAAIYPGLYMKARKMLFQYKLFGTCRNAAKNPIFIEACRARTLSVDFSQPHVTSVLCRLKRNIVNNTWRPLAPRPARDWDDLDIWPRDEPVGLDGNTQIVRIILG